MSLDLFIHTPLINLENRKLLFFPRTGIRAFFIGTRIFLVCSVVAALTDLPHQKRIFLKPYFFCQFSGGVTININSEFCESEILSAVPVCRQRCSNTRWLA